MYILKLIEFEKFCLLAWLNPLIHFNDDIDVILNSGRKQNKTLFLNVLYEKCTVFWVV